MHTFGRGNLIFPPKYRSPFNTTPSNVGLELPPNIKAGEGFFGGGRFFPLTALRLLATSKRPSHWANGGTSRTMPSCLLHAVPPRHLPGDITSVLRRDMWSGAPSLKRKPANAGRVMEGNEPAQSTTGGGGLLPSSPLARLLGRSRAGGLLSFRAFGDRLRVCGGCRSLAFAPGRCSGTRPRGGGYPSGVSTSGSRGV